MSNTPTPTPKPAASPAPWRTVAHGGEVTWLAPEAGTRVQGVLVGRRTAVDGDGAAYAYHLLRLTEAGELPTVRERQRVTVALEEGAIVHVRETAALRELGAYARFGEAYEVRLHWIEKASIGRGRTAWRVSIEARQIAPRVLTPELPAPPAVSGDAPGVDGEDIPF